MSALRRVQTGQRCKPSSPNPIGQKCSQLQQYCHCTAAGDLASPPKSSSPKIWPRFSHLIGLCRGAKKPFLCSGQNTLSPGNPFPDSLPFKLCLARSIRRKIDGGDCCRRCRPGAKLEMSERGSACSRCRALRHDAGFYGPRLIPMRSFAQAWNVLQFGVKIRWCYFA